MAVVYTNDLWTIGSRRISSRSYPEPVTLNDVFAAIKGEDGSNVAAIEAFSFWFCENYPDGFEAGEALLCQEPPSVERTKQLYISLVPKDVRYEGAVLWDGERNYYDDSDFYAVVWDDEKNAPKEVGYATTRGWTYNNGAAVDATPDVLAKFAAWQAKERALSHLLGLRNGAAEAHSGAKVVVAKGRKIAKGKTGTVFGVQHCTFANYHGKTYKIWVKWDDGSGADMVDVKNLTVTEARSDVAAALAAAVAKYEAAEAAFAALLH